MRIVLAIYIFVHGFAHLVGFFSYFKILKSDDMPYTTTLFDGKLDIGDTGMKIMGVVWLIISIAFFYTGVLALKEIPLWWTYALATTLVSLVFTISGWPDTRFGILANLLLIIFLIGDNHFHWIP